MVEDAFAELSLPRAPLIDEAALAQRFDELSRARHPDAGGDAAAFARLTEARALLASPARRWRHWLALEFPGTPLEGPLPPAVMDLFARLSPALQEAQAVLARRRHAATPLAQALLAPGLLRAREVLEDHAARLAARLAALEAQARQAPPEPAVWAALAREAGFLEKWQAQTREALARLALAL